MPEMSVGVIMSPPGPFGPPMASQPGCPAVHIELGPPGPVLPGPGMKPPGVFDDSDEHAATMPPNATARSMTRTNLPDVPALARSNPEVNIDLKTSPSNRKLAREMLRALPDVALLEYHKLFGGAHRTSTCAAARRESVRCECTFCRQKLPDLIAPITSARAARACNAPAA